jgi:small neutral amino acid transporter SnatA (MarC family)
LCGEEMSIVVTVVLCFLLGMFLCSIFGSSILALLGIAVAGASLAGVIVLIGKLFS